MNLADWQRRLISVGYMVSNREDSKHRGTGVCRVCLAGRQNSRLILGCKSLHVAASVLAVID